MAAQSVALPDIETREAEIRDQRSVSSDPWVSPHGRTVRKSATRSGSCHPIIAVAERRRRQPTAFVMCHITGPLT
jgi:hypothetical protein